MTNQVERYRTDRLPETQEAQEFLNWSKELAKCPFYANLGAGGVIAILLTARELGLPPMASLNGGMYHIDGKVSLSAQMMNTLILKAGHIVERVELTENICTLSFQRNDRSDPELYSYSIEDARKAGYLGKNNWKQHPKDMLFCRALSGGARKICPDSIGNCYMHGELSKGKIPTNHSYPLLPAMIDDSPHDEKEIKLDDSDNYEEFVKTHKLNEKNDRSDYIEAVTSTSKKTKEEIVNFAMLNEERFESGFKKWMANKKPTTDQEVLKESPEPS